ncbi:MAG: hypothetical protein EXR71_01985 [Myxococcales bacterium]|nr:hypothetical protein [Myxococcales bacterium]
MRRPIPLLLLAAACTGVPEENVRRPCPDDPAWDPNLSVALRWGDSGEVELNEHLAQRLSLVDADGGEVEAFPFAFPGGLGLCVLGGLPPGRDFSWTVTEGAEPRIQEVDAVATLRPGPWGFHTAAARWHPGDHWAVDALVSAPMPLVFTHPVFLPAPQVRGVL